MTAAHAAEGLRLDLGTHSFSAEAILAFARQYDFQRFHVDEDAARQTHFGTLSASGWHTAAVFSEALNTAFATDPRTAGLKLGPWRNIAPLRWLKPVRAADTLAFEARFLDIVPEPNTSSAHVCTLSGTGVNQRGELAFALEGRILLLENASSPEADQ